MIDKEDMKYIRSGMLVDNDDLDGELTEAKETMSFKEPSEGKEEDDPVYERREKNSLVVTTPYMLRDDGELLECGEVHPYLKPFFSKNVMENLVYVIETHPQDIRWFYDNTEVDEMRGLIEHLLFSINQSEEFSEEARRNAKRELDSIRPQDEPDEVDVEEAYKRLIEMSRVEFCLVRTSNIKYKYGGYNGEIYFRLMDKNESWLDCIWQCVADNERQLRIVTVVLDYQTFGMQYAYCKVGKDKIDHMPTGEFLSHEGGLSFAQ